MVLDVGPEVRCRELLARKQCGMRRERTQNAVPHGIDVEQRQGWAYGVLWRSRQGIGEKAAQAQEVTVAQRTELRPARGTRGVDVGRDFMRLAIHPRTRRCTLVSAGAQNLDGAVPGGLHVHLGFVALRKRSGIASDPEDAVRREVVEHGSE